jgi:hypothetical protein
LSRAIEASAPAPLARKLGIAPGARVAALGAPERFAARLEGAFVSARLRGSFDVIIQFAPALALIERRRDALIAALEPRGRLGVAWPKRSSGVASDLDDRVVRETMLASGLVDKKVCAIDETWSALCFVRRRDPH